MPEKIEPALSAEEWAERRGEQVTHGPFMDSARFEGEWHKIVAFANDQLPDSDDRKITREKLDDFASCAGWARGEGQADLADRAEQMIRALESYLPPSTTE